MPESVMTLFPHVLNSFELMKVPLQAALATNRIQMQSVAAGFAVFKNTHDLALNLTRRYSDLLTPAFQQNSDILLKLYQEGAASLPDLFKENFLGQLNHFHQNRAGELKFIRLFTDQYGRQDWSVEYDPAKILIDLPGMRVIDISADVRHRIHNYGVVFAPRAGHHSNIAERVALYMRDKGLTRMAVVEQKCAEDIPLYIDGERHDEGFDGQVTQYRKVLEHLKALTGNPAHLIAVCQPGPLLISTLILNPHLAKTFGSAGAPMNTEGERGFLTDFSRQVGEDYIDRLLAFFGRKISEEHPGAGRETFDGRLQVLGFYFLGIDQHVRNLRGLLTDLKQGNRESAERQITFYQWYNYAHHFPADFVCDTFKKIFIGNELINGTLSIGDNKIGVKDYPASVPIWALGGTKDDIAPPLQATGHMNLIDSVPPEDKLTLICEGGHMGLFRSRKVLDNYYHRIAEFILSHSDKTGG